MAIQKKVSLLCSLARDDGSEVYIFNMVIKQSFKKLALIFFNLITMTAHADVTSSDITCSVFDNSCVNQPTMLNLAQLSPRPTVNKDVPILLSSSANSFTNSMSKITVLNNGVYLGAQANYSTRLNITDYLFMQNSRLLGVGGSMQVMNIPVNWVDNNDPGGRIYVGYNFNDHFALEERYTRFTMGNIHQMTDIQYNSYMRIPTNNAYELIARQSIALTHGLSLLVKEGEALISTDLRAADDQTLISSGASDHHDMVRPIVGLGAGYSIAQNITADLSYSYLLGTSAIHAQMVSAGLTYSIG